MCLKQQSLVHLQQCDCVMCQCEMLEDWIMRPIVWPAIKQNSVKTPIIDTGLEGSVF